MTPLLTGAGLQTATYVTGIALGLVLTPYLYRTLGERHYAIFLIAGLFTNWCGLIDFGMTTSVSRFVTFHFSGDDPKAVNETANTAFALMAILAAIALVVGGIAAALAGIGWPNDPDIGLFRAVFLMTAATFAVSKIADSAAGVINGVLRQELTGGAALLLRLATGGVTFLILYLGGRVIALLTGGLLLAIGNLMLLAVLVPAAWPEFRFSFSLFRFERVRELCGYSAWTFVNQIGDLLIARSDLILIGALLSLTDLAHYNLAVVVFISYYGSFLQAMTLWETNWFTHLMKTDQEAAFERTRVFSYQLLTFVTVFMSFMLIFWGKAFLVRWVGQECLAAYPALVILASSLALYRGCAETNIRLLQGMARHRNLAFFTLLQGAASVAAAALLLSLGFGLTGVALGAMIPAVLVHALIVPIQVCRLRAEPIVRYFARQARWIIIASIALIAPYFLLRRFVAPDYPTLLWTAAACAVLYAAAITVIGLSKSDRRAILSLLRRTRSDSDASGDSGRQRA